MPFTLVKLERISPWTVMYAEQHMLTSSQDASIRQRRRQQCLTHVTVWRNTNNALSDYCSDLVSITRMLIILSHLRRKHQDNPQWPSSCFCVVIEVVFFMFVCQNAVIRSSYYVCLLQLLQTRNTTQRTNVQKRQPAINIANSSSTPCWKCLNKYQSASTTHVLINHACATPA